MKELLLRIPVTRMTIQRMVREGRFPAPVHVTDWRLAWRWDDVLAWLRSRMPGRIEKPARLKKRTHDAA